VPVVVSVPLSVWVPVLLYVQRSLALLVNDDARRV
jgi:hypothetical protein